MVCCQHHCLIKAEQVLPRCTVCCMCRAALLNPNTAAIYATQKSHRLCQPVKSVLSVSQSLTNPGSIASHEKIPDHRDKLLTMSRSLVEGIKGLLSSLSSKEAMTESAEGCARTLQQIVQEVKAGSASLDPQLHDAKES